jgi:hypothetical protein
MGHDLDFPVGRSDTLFELTYSVLAYLFHPCRRAEGKCQSRVPDSSSGAGHVPVSVLQLELNPVNICRFTTCGGRSYLQVLGRVFGCLLHDMSPTISSTRLQDYMCRLQACEPGKRSPCRIYSPRLDISGTAPESKPQGSY